MSTNLLRFIRHTPCSSSLTKPRFFSVSSAAIQYESESESDSDYDLMVDDQGSKAVRGVQWVVLGQPGAKKHFYAEKLAKVLDVPHINMASLVLQELYPSSSLYNKIKTSVSQGKLVPEEIIFGLLSKRLEEGYFRGETGFILDGIPRTRMHAEVLDQIVDIDLVLNFKCPGKVERKLANGLNIHPQDSQVRSLSEEVARREKLLAYAEQSKLLADFYRRQKKLLDFEVSEGHSETWRNLLSVLHLQHVKPSFQKLTA